MWVEFVCIVFINQGKGCFDFFSEQPFFAGQTHEKFNKNFNRQTANNLQRNSYLCKNFFTPDTVQI